MWNEAAHFLRYLKKVVMHLSKGAWPFWAVVGILAVPFVVIKLLFGAAEPAFRLTGMVLQVIGFGCSMWDLLSLGKLFGLPSLLAAIIRFWNSFPRYRVTHVLNAKGGSVATFGGTADINVIREPDATLDRRVEWLESDVKALQILVKTVQEKADAERERIEADLKTKISKLKSELDALNKKMQEALAGGVTLQWVGILCFVYGVILASASVELSRCLS